MPNLDSTAYPPIRGEGDSVTKCPERKPRTSSWQGTCYLDQAVDLVGGNTVTSGEGGRCAFGARRLCHFEWAAW